MELKVGLQGYQELAFATPTVPGRHVNRTSAFLGRGPHKADISEEIHSLHCISARRSRNEGCDTRHASETGSSMKKSGPFGETGAWNLVPSSLPKDQPSLSKSSTDLLDRNMDKACEVKFPAQDA